MLAIPLTFALFKNSFCSSAKRKLALSGEAIFNARRVPESDSVRAFWRRSALIISMAIFCQLYCLAPCSAGNDGSANAQSAPFSQNPSTGVTQVTPSSDALPAEKILLKPGQPLSIGMQTEDLVPTDDVELARRQVSAYPDNPEASFILAVALTRTSRVEEALKEVRRARKLADGKGGPTYFDHMIGAYEKMLTYCPEDNRIRYGLAWAYYMKAYLLAQNSKKLAKLQSLQNPIQDKPNLSIPHIEGALEKAAPDVVPQIKKYYESALTNLDDLLARKPDDIWARVYRAHLNAEYTGNLEESMAVWRSCRTKHPENPAPYFFLGEGYLKQGNLKECLNNISRAIALRAIGN